jgi:hypothetical protein
MKRGIGVRKRRVSAEEASATQQRQHACATVQRAKVNDQSTLHRVIKWISTFIEFHRFADQSIKRGIYVRTYVYYAHDTYVE